MGKEEKAEQVRGDMRDKELRKGGRLEDKRRREGVCREGYTWIAGWDCE